MSVASRTPSTRPSPPGLRDRKKNATRAAIEAAALRLFESRGYDATTVVEIAAAADVSPRTVFSYFAAKEDILYADEADFLARLEATLRDRAEGASTATALRAFLTAPGPDEARARLRGRIIAASEQLEGRDRARTSRVAEIISASIARDLDAERDDLRPTLAADAVVNAFASARNRRLQGRRHPLTHGETLYVLELALDVLEAAVAALRTRPAQPPAVS